MVKKSKSKRQTLKDKYKIAKRTKEHHRKLKKGIIVGKKFKKKQVDHIPNAWPYKEDLLKEIQNAKDKMEEVTKRAKEKRQEEIKKRREKLSSNQMDIETSGDSNTNLEMVASKTEEQNEPLDGDNLDNSTKNLGQNSRRAYLRELRKVVERADVILHVLDARDPMGTKSSAIEDMVLSNSEKKFAFVLNKCDLVPKDVLIGWLEYLRQFQPTIPFKCNTQNQKENLSVSMGKISKQQEGSLKTNHAVGAEELIGLLKNYSRVGDSKSIISVGIVGFPNVGKSSLINSLMRSRSVGVSAMPGFTKVSQEVILDKNIRLIDSPGIVFADGDSAATVLRNCVNIEEMVDVYTPIQAILQRCPTAYLMQLYNIPRFTDQDCLSFLGLVAKSTGKLKKGGIPNTDAAARSVLHDWNNGKIKYYCKAPKLLTNATEKESKIVSSFSNSFNVEDSKNSEIKVIDDIYGSAESGGGSMPQEYFVSMDSLEEKVMNVDK